MSNKLIFHKETLQTLTATDAHQAVGGDPRKMSRLPVCDTEFCTVQMGTHCMPCRIDPSIIDPICK